MSYYGFKHLPERVQLFSQHWWKENVQSHNNWTVNMLRSSGLVLNGHCDGDYEFPSSSLFFLTTTCQQFKINVKTHSAGFLISQRWEPVGIAAGPRLIKTQWQHCQIQNSRNTGCNTVSSKMAMYWDTVHRDKEGLRQESMTTISKGQSVACDR